MNPSSPVRILPHRGRFLLVVCGEPILVVATFSQALAWAEVVPVPLADALEELAGRAA